MSDQDDGMPASTGQAESHCVFLTDGEGRKIGERIFKHSGEGLAEMAAWLMKTSGAAEPSQIYGRHRGSARPGGRDADRARLRRPRHQPQADGSLPRPVLAGRRQGRQPRRRGDGFGLRTDPRCFRLLAAADPVVVELREWSRIAEELGVERNRLANRLREQLWRYFPAMLELERRSRRRVAARPVAARRRRPQKAAACARRRSPNCSSAIASAASTPRMSWTVLRKPPVQRRRRNGRGRQRPCRDAHCAHPACSTGRSTRPTPDRRPHRTPHRQPRRPSRGRQKQHDAEILASLPGVGRTVLATLLAEAWDASAATRLRRLAQFDRGRACHQAVGQELHRRPKAGLP